MAGFSSTDVAFEGFRVTREHPGSVLVWAALSLVVSVLSILALIGLGGTALADFQAASQSGNPDPSVVMPLFARLAPGFGLATVLTLAFYAVLYAAVFRTVLRPGDTSPGHLNLGGDELRQFIVTVLLGLLYVAVGIFGGVLTGVAGALAGDGAGAVSVLLVLALVIGLVVLAVRLSLANAQTFDEGRVNLFGSWRLTKGRFWALLGAYVLCIAVVVVVSLLANVIILAVLAGVTAATGGEFTSVTTVYQPDMTSLGAFFTPVVIVYQILTALLTAVMLAALAAPTAAAYRALSPNPRGEAVT